MTEDQNITTNPYSSSSNHPSAFNPYGMSSYSGLPGSTYSSYSSYPSYGGMGGFGSPYGYGYGGGLGGDHLWQGFLGQTAESLGRFNNLLSMTGMLVEHISNHGKLLYGKGLELHKWYNEMRALSEKHSEWMERLGFQIESGWATNEDEEVRKRRMLIRRTRTFLILGFVITLFYYAVKKRRSNRAKRWETIYQGTPRPHPLR